MEESNLVMERKHTHKSTGNHERRGSFWLSLRHPIMAVSNPVDEFCKVSSTHIPIGMCFVTASAVVENV